MLVEFAQGKIKELGGRLSRPSFTMEPTEKGLQNLSTVVEAAQSSELAVFLPDRIPSMPGRIGTLIVSANHDGRSLLARFRHVNLDHLRGDTPIEGKDLTRPPESSASLANVNRSIVTSEADFRVTVDKRNKLKFKVVKRADRTNNIDTVWLSELFNTGSTIRISENHNGTLPVNEAAPLPVAA